MLLEFRVCNFRSFGEESVLSLVASTDSELAETNTALTGIASPPRAVRSAVVYGANASGKSNLLRAMQLMRGVVLESVVLKPDQTFNVQPFRFSEKLKSEPTLFEMTFVLDGVRHQYGFEFTPARIISEWLLVYQKAKPQRWIDRRYDPKTQEESFEFSSHLSGQKRAWQDATRPNALFLSTAVQLNSEQLKPIHSWFTESLIVLMDGGMLPFNYSTDMVRHPGGESAIRSIMTAADIAIAEIRAVPKKSIMQAIKFDLATGASEASREEGEILVPEFTHKAGEVRADFEFQDESQGTQKLFALAGPLLDIIRNGKILVIDELDRSLHPLLVRQIINTFQDHVLNERGAQLFFTTHDTSLLDHQLLRRDQIWLTEKNLDQSSTLVPLTRFSPRKGEALERGYLSGRYGGVPILDQKLVARSGRGKK
ncbi:MAG TPA: phage resistance protein [Hyphomonadaceae bacterium]|nr:phage resistance protein [Hyphomonadaceae bacterium]